MSNLLGREFLCMKQSRREDVYVTVPETGSHNEALTVNYGGILWDFDRSSRSNGLNMAVVYEDRAVFDWRLSGGRVNPCSNQGQVRGKDGATCKKYASQEKRQS